MIEENKLPDDWSVMKASEVGDVVTGGTPDTNVDEYWGGNIPWLRVSDVGGSLFVSTSEDRITDEGLKSGSCSLLSEGSVIIATRATIGDVAIAGTELATNQGFKSIEANEEITSKFLAYYIMSSSDYLKSLGKGATFDEVNKTQIENLDIPVPPLDEQERIVEAVEERLERVERLEKSVENVGRLADEYQDSYLADLVTGGSESAVENLGHKLTTEDVPDNWDVKKVSKVVSAKNGGTPKRSEKKYWGGNIGWLSSGEVKGKYTNSAEESINQFAIEESSAKIFPENSVLVAMYGSGTRGQSTIVTDEMSGNQAICCLIPNDDVLSEYLLYFYKSIEDRLASKARGATQRNLNQSMVINEMIPVPPIEEQSEIINDIEKYNFSKVQKSSSLLSEHFNEYKDSVLSHAFNGDLRRLTSSRSERVS